MTISDIAATLTGERMIVKNTGGRQRPTRDEIAQLAYHLYETRGRQHGKDMDDWLSAERKLTQGEEVGQILCQRRPRREPNYPLALPDEALETALRLW
jgi:hypothetical protein